MAASITPLADAEIIASMRDPHFRIGWLEATLEEDLDTLRRVLPSIRASHTGTRHNIERRIENIERTLRLAKAAREPRPALDAIVSALNDKVAAEKAAEKKAAFVVPVPRTEPPSP